MDRTIIDNHEADVTIQIFDEILRDAGRRNSIARGGAYRSAHQRGKKICIGPSRMMWTSGWSLADQT